MLYGNVEAEEDATGYSFRTLPTREQIQKFLYVIENYIEDNPGGPEGPVELDRTISHFTALYLFPEYYALAEQKSQTSNPAEKNLIQEQLDNFLDDKSKYSSIVGKFYTDLGDTT